MDSGIDSTDSSNGSVEEGGGGGADVVMEGDALTDSVNDPSPRAPHPSPSPNSPHASPSPSSPHPSSLHGSPHPSPSPGSPQLSLSSSSPRPSPPEAPAPTTLRSLAAAAAATNPVPSQLKTLAATAVNDMPLEGIETRNSNETELSLSGASSVDSSSNTPVCVFKMAKMNVPEGSRLQLHFPLSEGGNIEEDGTTFDLEPPPGLTFANVSPSMYLSHGYEIYSQGYSVVPYENNVLQKKLRSLRQRMRQHQQYQVLSPKAKERKLRIAVSLNNVETVEQLLREGVNPKVTDDKERSPLHIAASKGYTDTARLLLQYGADPNQRDAIGNTALHLAACTSHIPTVTLLLKSGTNVRQTDNQGYSPLHLARSKLKLLQRDNNSSSQEIKKQVYQVIEMMQTFLECSGSVEEAELLTSFTSQLSLSDSRQQVESDVQALLNSLNDLSLVKSKAA
ncbi:poly [ADP-ribose] polymerase tankyrase-1 isoform X2 [Procambarus clarkii]|uniref:poly [ADP-ribose] polymerase tankyrase-1 isoform X2 n=1 Tax=Procambarus clarkii TaxID=6728 RepID=UPI001E671E71|nr:uncharacterized protein LOC123753929 [Procambarus clarkii]